MGYNCVNGPVWESHINDRPLLRETRWVFISLWTVKSPGPEEGITFFRTKTVFRSSSSLLRTTQQTVSDSLFLFLYYLWSRKEQSFVGRVTVIFINFNPFVFLLVIKVVQHSDIVWQIKEEIIKIPRFDPILGDNRNWERKRIQLWYDSPYLKKYRSWDWKRDIGGGWLERLGRSPEDSVR